MLFTVPGCGSGVGGKGATGEEHASSLSSNLFSESTSGMLIMGIWKTGGGFEGLGDSGGAQTVGGVGKGILHGESFDFGLELAFLLGDSCALLWESLALCSNLVAFLGEPCIFLGESCALCGESCAFCGDVGSVPLTGKAAGSLSGFFSFLRM